MTISHVLALLAAALLAVSAIVLRNKAWARVAAVVWTLTFSGVFLSGELLAGQRLAIGKWLEVKGQTAPSPDFLAGVAASFEIFEPTSVYLFISAFILGILAIWPRGR